MAENKVNRELFELIAEMKENKLRQKSVQQPDIESESRIKIKSIKIDDNSKYAMKLANISKDHLKEDQVQNSLSDNQIDMFLDQNIRTELKKSNIDDTSSIINNEPFQFTETKFDCNLSNSDSSDASTQNVEPVISEIKNDVEEVKIIIKDQKPLDEIKLSIKKSRNMIDHHKPTSVDNTELIKQRIPEIKLNKKIINYETEFGPIIEKYRPKNSKRQQMESIKSKSEIEQRTFSIRNSRMIVIHSDRDNKSKRIRKEILKFNLNNSRFKEPNKKLVQNSLKKEFLLPKRIFRKNYLNSYWKKNSTKRSKSKERKKKVNLRYDENLRINWKFKDQDKTN